MRYANTFPSRLNLLILFDPQYGHLSMWSSYTFPSYMIESATCTPILRNSGMYSGISFGFGGLMLARLLSMGGGTGQIVRLGEIDPSVKC
jgi:hypothetical protein